MAADRRSPDPTTSLPPPARRRRCSSAPPRAHHGASDVMTAARRRRPAPIYVFDTEVCAGEHLTTTCRRPREEGWTEIEIVRRKAYGCGDNIEEALKGLSLHVLLADDPLVSVGSSFAIRINREAHERLNSELESRSPKYRSLAYMNNSMTAVANIILMDEEQDLMIMMLLLEREDLRHLAYYLVYDHKNASLSMISYVPDSPEVICMFKPIPKRTSDGAYELFLMARDGSNGLPMARDTDPPPFLYVFSPLMGAKKNNLTICGAWEVKRRARWNVPVSVYKRLRINMTFSFQGKGIWVDLTQAIIYCDLQTTDSVVDFDCIKLPVECHLTLDDAMDCIDESSMEWNRTMGCVRGSIWFVCIHRGKHNVDDDLVTIMWTLELPCGLWKNEARFSVRELWRFDGFREAGLPEAQMGYPVLMADGTLCLMMPGWFRRFMGGSHMHL